MLPQGAPNRGSVEWSGATVRRFRRALGATQAAFGALLGVNEREVRYWERDRFRPGREARTRLGLLLAGFPELRDQVADAATGEEAPPPSRVLPRPFELAGFLRSRLARQIALLRTQLGFSTPT